LLGKESVMTEGKKLDPLIYEHETEEEAASYDKWFREKVQASLDDPGEGIPHDEVMRQTDEVIEAAAARRGDKPVTNAYDPLISEFDSAEAEAGYEKWLIARVERSIADPRPSIPHAEVAAGAEAIIARAEMRLKKLA
jgi:hypothetical protein